MNVFFCQNHDSRHRLFLRASEIKFAATVFQTMLNHWWVINNESSQCQNVKKLTYCSHFSIFLKTLILIISVNLSVSSNSGRTSSEINCFRTIMCPLCPLFHPSKIFNSFAWGLFQRFFPKIFSWKYLTSIASKISSLEKLTV